MNAGRWSRDALIAAVVIALSFTPWVRDKGTILGWDTPQRPFDVLAGVLVVAHGLPLLVRSRFPVLCLSLVSLAFAAYQILGFRPTFASVALYLALFSAGVRQRRGRWVTAVVWTLGYAVTCVILVRTGVPSPVVEYGYFFAIPAACWLGGGWAHGELLRRREQQRHAVESALRDEREHLARELHDVVTHHVTAMIMQADAARFVPPEDHERVGAGLITVRDTGRRAMGDLRRLLDVLSPGDDDEPSLTDLVERIRLAGQPVELIVEGAVRSEGAVGSIVAYRVVQEALTNALKHAPGQPTVVRARSGDDGRVTVEVTTAAPEEGPPAPVRRGRGLTGLSRRVELAGGEFDVHRDDSGAFVVRATL